MNRDGDRKDDSNAHMSGRDQRNGSTMMLHIGSEERRYSAKKGAEKFTAGENKDSDVDELAHCHSPYSQFSSVEEGSADCERGALRFAVFAMDVSTT